MPTVKQTWFSYPETKPHAKLRLFCFPYAGGGGHVYIPWKKHLLDSVELVVAQLPGRGTRMMEPALTSLSHSVQGLAQGLLPHLNKPYVFFGHSMGAILAFEIARQLRRWQKPLPKHLFMAGRRAPQVPDPDPPTYHLPEAEFIQELKRLNGTPKEVLEHQELMALLMPTLRADFQACETYQYQQESALPCPMTAIGGINDENASDAEILAWQQQTTAEFTHVSFAGDHFFLHASQSELLKLLNQQLQRIIEQ